ncbi:MAG: glycosyl hydrolase [Paenibacillus sp.]|jgi:cellulose synthase/poly-beta-1,6-N-acetylglucosamine synthase-like glycosyltransferase|nr:glycosyl hydrolase [Paenibacillus sp.]
MAIAIWTVVMLLVVQIVFARWNLNQLPALGSRDSRKSYSSPGAKTVSCQKTENNGIWLSVLIPARNEAGRIGDCLASVSAAAEDDCGVEIWVLDDESDDGTATVVERMGQRDSRIGLLAGTPLPAGWIGKSHACRQLASRASGDWFLFLDADTRLEKGCLRALRDTLSSQGDWGLVTGFPRQETETWMERLVVPLMMFTVACHLPCRLVAGSADPRFVAAHGAFMCIHRMTYETIGGHAAFSSHLVDDMELARRVKRAGHPVRLASIHRFVYMRMYENAAQVWKGYAKNVFPGLGRNGLLLFGVLFSYAFLYLFPLLTLCSSIGHPDLFLPSILALALGFGLKAIVDRSSGVSPKYAWTLPAAICLLIAIGVASWTIAATGNTYEWKGRRYT